MQKKIYLSYPLDQEMPCYGNMEKVSINRVSSIEHGCMANQSRIITSLHNGTHIDFPFHFYKNGQTVDNYSPDFWFFDNPILLEIKPRGQILCQEIIEKILRINCKSADILIVKTGICNMRDKDIYWQKNYGFSSDLYSFFKKHMPDLKVFGFDSVSVSSFAERESGRLAHRVFLNPSDPILLLEDMNLCDISKNMELKKVIVAPIRVKGCDASLCTVWGIFDD